MKNKFLLLIILFLLSSSPFYAEGVSIINLDNRGIKDVDDATPIVVEALKDCKELGIKKIVFPKGVYHFYPTFAPDRYCAITNNDNGLKRTSFPIIGYESLEIDGNGSEFIFHGKLVPFIIEESKNISIKNLSINWKVPFFLQGEVVANNSSEKTFDIRIKTPYKVEDGLLYLRLEREDSPYERNYGFRFAEGEKYNMVVGQSIVFDRTTKAPIYNEKMYSGFGATHFPAKELAEGLVRLTTPYEMVPPIGSVFCSKGEYLFNREVPAFRLFKSQDLSFSNIDVHHAGAMGMIAERCVDITLDAFNVVLKEGEGRIITTTADATHFCNCRGLITIKNCIFENMLDDATNIHGTYVRVNKVLDDFRVAIETYHPHQNGFLFGEPGDSVQIIHRDNLLPTTGHLLLKDIERVNEKISILTFDKPVKGKVDLYYGIDNVSWHASAILENNIVRNNRARSFLISTPRKVVVRNNQLSSQMCAFRITGDLGLWNESGPCDSLVIENNTILDCVYSGNGNMAVIQIDPQYESEELKGKYSRNIIIRNNQIKTFDSSILKALSVDGLVFENNDIIQTKTYKPLNPTAPNLKIENCNNVSIKNNTYKSLDKKKGSISIDKMSSNLNVSDKTFNKLLFNSKSR